MSEPHVSDLGDQKRTYIGRIRVAEPDETEAKLRQRICELEAVVEKLPRTKDGVVVVPGMRLYYLETHYNDDGDPSSVSVQECDVCHRWEKTDVSSMPYPNYKQERSCYASREAAYTAADQEEEAGQ